MKQISFKDLWNKLQHWKTRNMTNIKFDGKVWAISGYGETWIHEHKYIIGTRFESHYEGFVRVDRKIYEYEWKQ
jgi:hypothetical protein